MIFLCIHICVFVSYVYTQYLLTRVCGMCVKYMCGRCVYTLSNLI